jgi:hypothetical protein
VCAWVVPLSTAVGVVVGRCCGDAFNGLGLIRMGSGARVGRIYLIVGIPVYFAGGFSVGRCKVRNFAVELGVGLAHVQTVYAGFGVAASFV